MRIIVHPVVSSHMNTPALSARFPWYDSIWLQQYVAAQAFLAANHPQRLQPFIDAMAPLRTRPDFETSLLSGVIDEAMLGRIRAALAGLKPADLELHEIKTFGRWVVHDNPILTELQDRMTALVSDVVGEPVERSYNFLSLYTRLGRCPVHMDAPSAKWTLDICIDQSHEWPIHFSQVQPWPEASDYSMDDWEQRILGDPANRFESHIIQPGDAAVFSGSSQWHYRDPLPVAGGKGFCHLLFFHFIPQGVSGYLDPEGWEAYFDAPGLGAVVSQERPAGTPTMGGMA